MRPRRRRHPGGVRHQPARALDQGHGLLLPRPVPHRVATDRPRLRPRAGQEAAVVYARAHDRGAGARHRQRVDPAARRRRAQHLEPAHPHHRALRAHELRGQRRGRALPLHHRRRGGGALAARRRARRGARGRDPVRGHDPGHRHAPLLRPLDRRPCDGHSTHQDRAVIPSRSARSASTARSSPTSTPASSTS
jgi:hypothetical protein